MATAVPKAINTGLLGGSLLPRMMYHGNNVYGQLFLKMVNTPAKGLLNIVNSGMSVPRGVAGMLREVSPETYGRVANTTENMLASIDTDALSAGLRKLSMLGDLAPDGGVRIGNSGLVIPKSEIDELIGRAGLAQRSVADMQFTADSYKELKRREKKGVLKAVSWLNPVNKTAFNLLASEVDFAARASAMKNALGMGMTADQAGTVGRRVLLDYSDMSRIERITSPPDSVLFIRQAESCADIKGFRSNRCAAPGCGHYEDQREAA